MSTGTQTIPAKIDQLLRNLDTIVTLPEITARIAAVVADDQSSAQDLHRIITHDPALVSRLLKLVNSAFYGRPGEVDSVQRAIVLLGFDGVYRLALAATVGPLFKGGRISEHFTAADLWTHCIAVGAVAKELAGAIGTIPREEAFLVGLLHDVGLLVVLKAYRGQLRQVCDQAHDQGNFNELEAQILGAGHADIGAILSKMWKFPPGVREVARHHHHPLTAPEALRDLTRLVYVADTLCCEQQIGFWLPAESQELDESIVQDLVPADLIETARANLEAWVAPALRFFT
jgi:putative nucleotidyltransferase with HDIG domain